MDRTSASKQTALLLSPRREALADVDMVQDQGQGAGGQGVDQGKGAAGAAEARPSKALRLQERPKQAADGSKENKAVPLQRTLYVADSATGIVWRWDVNTDGSLANQREFVRTEGMAPDGITVDVDANVYIASAIGIEVYRPDATRWGVIRGWPPNVRPANMAFGGPNMDYLLVAAER
jgi:hypothetical protein